MEAPCQSAVSVRGQHISNTCLALQTADSLRAESLTQCICWRSYNPKDILSVLIIDIASYRLAVYDNTLLADTFAIRNKEEMSTPVVEM